MKNFFLKFNKLITPIFLIGIIIVAYFIFINKNIQTASAGWWNDSWHYRKSIQITNNATAETNVYASTTIDTSDTTKFQADCGDLRFTKYIGEELPYYIVSGCGTATTTVHINFETFEAGTQTIFYYYGNPTADNGFATSDFSTEASDYTIGTVGSEEIGGGPVGYWSFNEGYGATAHDESSGGNDGTITGAVWKDESECIAGKCLWFDGSDDNVDLGMINEISTMSRNITVSAWLKTDRLSDVQRIFSSARENTNNGFGLGLNSAGLRFTSWDVNDYDLSGFSLLPNTWYYVSFVMNENNDVIFYVNGLNRGAAGSGAGINPNSDDKYYFGATTMNGAGTLTEFFKGYLDEVKIYPYARTADQVKQDYNAGLVGASAQSGTAVSFGSQSDKWLSDGLVGHWKMDETATTSGAIDASGNGNTGVYYGDASTTAGKFGRGGAFDGEDDYTDMGDIRETGDFTLGFWIKPLVTYNSGSSAATIISKYYNGNNSLSVVYSYSAGVMGKIDFKLEVGGATSRYELTTTTSTWNANQWYYITWIHGDTMDKTKILVNGIDEKNIVSTSGYPHGFNFLANLKIGGGESENAGVSYVNAIIDEVRLYNRTLTTNEVKKLYEYAPGPVLHLKMDEKVSGDAQTLSDVSGNGNNGTIVDGANNTGMNCTVQGKYGSGCEFDGVDDYVDVGTASMGLTENFTASAWINASSLGNVKTIFTSGNVGSNYWYLNFGNNSRIQLSEDTGTVVYGDTPLIANKWYYFTIVKDGEVGDNIRLYLDGNLDGSGSVGTTQESGIKSIGARYEGESPSLVFDGFIDDVRIYDYARTQKQILEDMNGSEGGRSGKGVNSPILDMDFDEGFGSTAHNKGIGGASLDGTLTPGAGGTNTTATQMWSLDGKNGKAMEFDGMDDYVDFGDKSQFEYGGIFSVSAWIKTSDANSSEIISKGGISDNWEFVVNKNAAGEIVFQVNECDGDPYLIYTTSGLNINDNEWHHIIGIADTSVLKIYVDGNYIGEDNTPALNPACTGGTSPLRVGYGTYTRNDWAGLIDEVKIYNYALTEDDIKTVYNSGVSAVMGSSGTDSATGNPTNASSGEYCVPGDTSTCDAPVLHLKMDEKTGTTAYDVSGNGNDGTLGGGTANYKPTWTTGKYGSALNFDGYDDEVYVGDILDSQSNLTVSAWVKWNTAYVNDERAFIVLKDYAFMLRSADTGHNFLFAINDGSWHESGNTTTSIDDGNWHHLVGLYNNEDVKIYVDGVEENSNNIGSTITASNANILEIGGANYNWASQHWNWNGQIDDVRIYNYARTPAQIAWDYNKGKPIAEWRFDECQGTVIHNDASTGSIFHGTLNQGATGITVPGTCKDGLSTSAWYLGSTGHQKASMYFDGLSDYVEILDNDLLDFTNSLTLSAWIKPTAAAQSLYSRIISKTPTGGGNELYALVTDNSPSNAPGIRITVGSSVDCFGNSIAPLNEWTHVLGTWNGTVSKLYFNGVLENTCAIAGTLPSATSNLRIGDREDSPDNRRFKGMIDEAEIFNYVLTDEQIKNEFNSGAVRFGE